MQIEWSSAAPSLRSLSQTVEQFGIPADDLLGPLPDPSPVPVLRDVALDGRENRRFERSPIPLGDLFELLLQFVRQIHGGHHSMIVPFHSGRTLQC